MAEAAIATKVDVRRWFYHWMALTCLAVAVLGFMPTFFMPLAVGTPIHHAPIVYIHGLLCFAWVIFFCTQTWFAASGRMLAHREWGLLGVAIAAAMVCSVIAVNVTLQNQASPRPPVFVMGQLDGIVFFTVCVAAALANVRRPEAHKRFMLLATISILAAPIARWWHIMVDGRIIAALDSAPPPGGVPDPITILLVNGSNEVTALLIIAPIVFDWRTRGRVSPIYWVGMPVLGLMQILSAPIGLSPAWAAVVGWLKHMGG